MVPGTRGVKPAVVTFFLVLVLIFARVLTAAILGVRCVVLGAVPILVAPTVGVSCLGALVTILRVGLTASVQQIKIALKLNTDKTEHICLIVYNIYD